MTSIILPPIPAKEPEKVYVVQGMRALRRDLTTVLKKAASGQQVHILERGVDRQVKKVYKVVEVHNHDYK